MRFLDLAEIAELNSLLSSLSPNDGSILSGRAECYSCNPMVLGVT